MSFHIYTLVQPLIL